MLTNLIIPQPNVWLVLVSHPTTRLPRLWPRVKYIIFVSLCIFLFVYITIGNIVTANKNLVESVTHRHSFIFDL